MNKKLAALWVAKMWVEGEKKKKASPQHVHSIQLQGSLNFFFFLLPQKKMNFSAVTQGQSCFSATPWVNRIGKITRHRNNLQECMTGSEYHIKLQISSRWKLSKQNSASTCYYYPN